jgi:hypothetical protein
MWQHQEQNWWYTSTMSSPNGLVRLDRHLYQDELKKSWWSRRRVAWVASDEPSYSGVILCSVFLSTSFSRAEQGCQASATLDRTGSLISLDCHF